MPLTTPSTPLLPPLPLDTLLLHMTSPRPRPASTPIRPRSAPPLRALTIACLLGLTFPGRAEVTPWINEFHYDNTGSDNNEFVEVAVPSSLTDLNSIRLTLYNGGDGRPYGTGHLLSSFTSGESTEGVTFYSKQIGGMQNGAPDGLALDLGGQVVHFVGYEGGFAATAGPAAGLFASDVGRTEGETTPPGGSLGLVGTGSGPGDFLWESLSEASPGGINSGQFMVPEPGPATLLTVFGGGAWLVSLWHRRKVIPNALPAPPVSEPPRETEGAAVGGRGSSDLS